jgi:hypothetical protein
VDKRKKCFDYTKDPEFAPGQLVMGKMQRDQCCDQNLGDFSQFYAKILAFY